MQKITQGDACNSNTWQEAVGDLKINLIITSPPYVGQRDYEGLTYDAHAWNDLMQAVFSAAISHCAPDVQIFTVLGKIHRDGEVVRYWEDWLDWMPFKLHGWYTWDKGSPLPGKWPRFGSRFEFIFHHTLKSIMPDKIMPNKTAGQVAGGGSVLRNADSVGDSRNPKKTQQYRVLDDVITIPREFHSKHPAPFPVGLPFVLIHSYPDHKVVMDPFAGSGTTLVAAQQLGRVGLGIEMNANYCSMARDRLGIVDACF